MVSKSSITTRISHTNYSPLNIILITTFSKKVKQLPESGAWFRSFLGKFQPFPSSLLLSSFNGIAQVGFSHCFRKMRKFSMKMTRDSKCHIFRCWSSQDEKLPTSSKKNLKLRQHNTIEKPLGCCRLGVDDLLLSCSLALQVFACYKVPSQVSEL